MLSEVAAGRELDAEIARCVFGELVVQWPGAREPVLANGSKRIRPYSTDMAAAWVIAQRLGIMVCPTLVGQWGAGVFLGTTGHPDGGRRYVIPGTWREAPTAPLAICRAALAAVANHEVTDVERATT